MKVSELKAMIADMSDDDIVAGFIVTPKDVRKVIDTEPEFQGTNWPESAILEIMDDEIKQQFNIPELIGFIIEEYSEDK